MPKAEETNRKQALAYIKVGDAARDSRQWDKAEQYYHSALDLQPDLEAIWVQYGHAVKEQGRPNDAERAYRRALQINDASSDSYVQLGHALKLQGRLKDAMDAYWAAFRRDKTNMNAIVELAEQATDIHGQVLPGDASIEEASELRVLLIALRQSSANDYWVFSHPAFLPKR